MPDGEPMNPELEDKDSAKLAQGRAMVSLWTDLLRSLRITDTRSEIVQSWGERIRALLGESCEGSEGASFAVRSDAIYFNGLRIPEFGPRASTYSAFARMLRISRVRSFHTDAEVELPELLAFADRLLAAGEGRATPEQIVEALKPSGASSIEVVIGNTEDDASAQIPGHELQRRVYLGAIGSVKSVFHGLKVDNRVNVKRLKRTVIELMTALQHDFQSALRMTCIKNYDEYTFNHSVNSCVMSMALGMRLGMSREMLYQLGLAALLHDLGKLQVPAMVLNKLGSLKPEERKLFHDHPAEGLFSIATQLGISSNTIAIALAAYEHHLNVDGTGYPAQATSREPTLISRIVAIVDRYDAMTSPRVYRTRPLTPARATSIMYHSQRNQIDRTLLAEFVQMLGRYPLGSAVRLSDGSVALVVGAPRDAETQEFPTVRRIRDAEGTRIHGEITDLAEDRATANALRVVEPLDSSEYDVAAEDFLH